MKDLTKKVQTVMQQGIDRGEIAGANVLILQDGHERVYAEAGYANIEEKKPYRRDTICRLYSLSKPVTAALAMLLMERGLLELGQPVGDILPGFRDMTVWENGQSVPAKRCLLVRHLLNMTSGFSYGGPDAAGQQIWRILEEMDERLYSGRPMSTKEYVNRLGGCDLSYHPGDAWEYGVSADVLGEVIAEVSGMSFGEFLQKELLKPLEMTDTGFYVPKEKQSRLADAYEKTADGMKLCVTNHLGIKYTMDIPPAFESGGAGLVSTIEDYSHFAIMLIQGGRYKDRQLLSPKTVEFLTGSRLTPWQKEKMWRLWDGMYGYNYGNLMRVMEEPLMASFHTWKGEYGWDGWLGTYFANSPGNGLTILLTAQRKDGGTMDVTRRLRNVLAANLDI